MKLIILFLTSTLLISCQPKSVENDGGLIIDLELLNNEISEREVNSALEIFRKRFDYIFEYSAEVLLSPDKKSIQIKLPMVTDSIFVKGFIVRKGEFKTVETYDISELYQYLEDINSKLAENQNYNSQSQANISDSGSSNLQKQISEVEKNKREENKFPLFNILSPNVSPDGNLLGGPAIGISMIKDTSLVDSIFNVFRKLFPYDFECKWSRIYQKNMVWLIALKTPKYETAITSEMIADARTSKSQFTESPEVNFTLKPEYVHLWTEMTRNNINRSLAILIDDDVFSYPKVVSEITGGNSSITGQFIDDEAKALVTILKYGPIPVNFKINKITKI
jgi:SecD/SecF fusion protein